MNPMLVQVHHVDLLAGKSKHARHAERDGKRRNRGEKVCFLVFMRLSKGETDDFV